MTESSIIQLKGHAKIRINVFLKKHTHFKVWE
jgi:hypothetical protein